MFGDDYRGTYGSNNMKIEYDYKENALIAHEIYIFIKEYGYEEFIKKYDVFACLQINHEIIESIEKTSSCGWYWGQGEMSKPIPTGAPGVLGLSDSEICFIKNACTNGICLGKHFFDDNNDWKKVVSEEDLSAFGLTLVNLLLSRSNDYSYFPYNLYLKLKEVII